MPPKRGRAATPFKTDHCLEYGLKIMTREPASSRVTAVRCEFCAFGGREEANPGAKRQRTTSVKYFSTFRVQYYKQHMTKQHASEWAAYQELPKEDKKGFFADRRVAVNILARHFEGENAYLFLIDRRIVDVIIGDLLFDPDDDEVELSRERALSFFKLQADAADDEAARDAYKVVIKASRQFRLALKFVACGASFRMTSRLLNETKDEAGLTFLVGCTDTKVSQFIRVVVAVNLQKIREVVEAAWAFSIALDGGHSAGTSYFDIRVRFCRDGVLHNLHLLALPIRDGKTASHLFDITKAALDVVIPEWRKKLIGISTDGERTMTGRLNGLATKFQQAAECNDVYRVWCALHQLDLVVQREYEKLHGEQFVELLTGLIGHLRRQQNLCTEMGTTCPKLALTRWGHMHRSTSWFAQHRIRVSRHLEEKAPPCTPPETWWIVLLSLDRVTAEVLKVVTQLQGLTTLVSQQSTLIAGLSQTLRELCPVEGPMSEEQMAAMDRNVYVFSGYYATRLDHARAFIDDMGSYAIEAMQRFALEEVKMIEASVAQLFVGLVNGIADVVAERSSSNAASVDLLPAVTPQRLVTLRGAEFAAIITRFKARLARNGMSEDAIEIIEREFAELKAAYRSEAPTKAAVDDNNDMASFRDSWNMFPGRFTRLHEFCGGIASVFPNTARVEADYSTIKREKNPMRASLSDFSLEGILHAGQFDILQSLK